MGYDDGLRSHVPRSLVLVVIGDLVDSRHARARTALQARFVDATARCNRPGAELLSPYTVTLGDEFQAVLGSAGRLFTDLAMMTAELLGAPELAATDDLSSSIRYSIAVGRLTTPLNHQHAIGMDGPAFHAARLGIEQLKKSGDSFMVSGLGDNLDELCNGLFALVTHEMITWNPRRHWILAERMRRTDVAVIAERLGVSSAAVYKNLTQGGVDIVCRNLLAVSKLIDAALESPLPS
jgi:hypothetical protein